MSAQVAQALATFLAARRDRVASDAGTIMVDVVDGRLVAVVGGAVYRIDLVVTPR